MTDHDCIEEVRTKLIRYCLLQEKCTHDTPCAACAPFVRVLAMAKITADEIAGIAPHIALVTPLEKPREKNPRSFLTAFRPRAHAAQSD